MFRSTAFLGALLPVLLVATPAAARPPTGLVKEATTIPFPSAPADLRAEGRLEVGTKRPSRLVRHFLLEPAAEAGRLVALPTGVELTGELSSIALSYEPPDGRTVTETPHTFYGTEGPCHGALLTPLAWLWSGVDAGPERVTLGYPTEEGRIRPPQGAGPAGAAVSDAAVEDPFLVMLFAPPTLDLVSALEAVPNEWTPDQERKTTRTVTRPTGLPPLRQTTTLVYDGTSDGRPLFEMEIVTTGDAYAGGLPWRVERRSTATLLVEKDGRLFQSKVETVAKGYGKGTDPVRTVTTTVEVRPQEAGAPPKADALARPEAFAKLLRLRQADPGAFQTALREETAKIARAYVEDAVPGTYLSAVTVVGAKGSATPTQGPGSGPDSVLAHTLLPVWGPVLERLGVVGDDTLAGVRAAADDPSAPRVRAVPSAHAVVVSAGAEGDIAATTRAFARFAALAVAGDAGKAEPGGATLPPAWQDVDALFATHALEEATDDVIADLALRGLANPLGLGFGLDVRAAALRRPTPSASLVERARAFALYGGIHYLAHHHEKEATLPDVLKVAWKDFPARTEALLSPGTKVGASALRAKSLALRGKGPVGGTRAGALLFGFFVETRLGLPRSEAQKATRAFRDDVVLSFPAGALWIVRTSDAGAAETLAKSCGAKLENVKVEARGADVLVESGEVPNLDATLAALLAG